MVQVTVLFHSFPLLMSFFVGLIKTETAAKPAPRVPKLCLNGGGRKPHLSAWGTRYVGGRRGLSNTLESKMAT